MKKINFLICLSVTMLLWTLTPAFGLTLNTSANYSTIGSLYSPPNESDADTGSTGTVSSSVGDGVFDASTEWNKIGAEASGNEDGYTAAFAGWRLWIGGDITADATVTWTDTLTADNGSGNYSWDFTITNGKLNIGDWCWGPIMTAGYNISFDVDGSDAWESSFEIVGGKPSGLTIIQSGTDLGGVYYENSNELGYEFSSYSGSLDLGYMNDGDSFDLTYLMNVYVAGPDYETDAQAYFGDPGNLTGGGGMHGVLRGQQPVPEPATMLLLGFGIIGLAGFRSKFKKA